MADSTRELDHIKEDIRVLHERSQDNKLKLAAHEASCDERYNSILTMLEDAHIQQVEIHKEIHRLSDLATQGKTSLKTLLWVGSIVAVAATLIYTLFTILPK